jgi:hypothetical protein
VFDAVCARATRVDRRDGESPARHRDPKRSAAVRHELDAARCLRDRRARALAAGPSAGQHGAGSSEHNDDVQFRLEGALPDYGVHPDSGGPLIFDVGGEHKLRVCLWTDHGREDVRLDYRVDAELQPPDNVRASFESLAAGRYPSDSQPENTLARGRVETGGTEIVRMARMGLMPPAFQGFAAELGGELRDTIVRILGLLRWRSGELGGPLQGVGRGFRWRLDDDGEWQPLPGETYLYITAYSLPELSAAARADLLRLHEDDVEEPFAYELIREAWAQRQANPRSALITSITALEIAVKQFIARRVPGADWLVENVATPDVIKLLREYLSTLDPPPGARPGAGRFEELPEELWRLLLKRRNQRNDIIHKPAAYEPAERPDLVPITPERAESAVLAVREVLYRLDLADGYAWAVAHLGSGTRPAPGFGYRRVG